MQKSRTDQVLPLGQKNSKQATKANSFWQETCYTDNIELKPMLLDSSEQSI